MLAVVLKSVNYINNRRRKTSHSYVFDRRGSLIFLIHVLSGSERLCLFGSILERILNGRRIEHGPDDQARSLRRRRGDGREGEGGGGTLGKERQSKSNSQGL